MVVELYTIISIIIQRPKSQPREKLKVQPDGQWLVLVGMPAIQWVGIGWYSSDTIGRYWLVFQRYYWLVLIGVPAIQWLIFVDVLG